MGPSAVPIARMKSPVELTIKFEYLSIRLMNRDPLPNDDFYKMFQLVTIHDPF